MTPLPGLVVAGGTAAAVLVVGLVFVLDVVPPTLGETPAASERPDKSDLSLEARRQARLTESQAMLGGGRPAPPEPEPPAAPGEAPLPAPAPEEAPLPPPAPAPAEAPLPPPRPASGEAPLRRPARVAAAARRAPIHETAPAPIPRPRGLAWQAAPPPTEVRPSPSRQPAGPYEGSAPPWPSSPCSIATSGTSAVAEACRQGGLRAAKVTMKRLLQEAKARGTRLTCDHCHVDLDTFTLRDGARSDFTSLLATAK
jgi:hypothetical protein